MQTDVSNEYLRSAVLTASPEQLQLMLYDGAIRFTTRARECMSRGELEKSCEFLLRAQRIVLELDSGLRHDINPQLCAQLAALYQFVYRRLVDANMTRSLDAVDDALRILQHQRETWELLIKKLRGEDDQTLPNSRPENGAALPSISIEC